MSGQVIQSPYVLSGSWDGRLLPSPLLCTGSNQLTVHQCQVPRQYLKVVNIYLSSLLKVFYCVKRVNTDDVDKIPRKRVTFHSNSYKLSKSSFRKETVTSICSFFTLLQ